MYFVLFLNITICQLSSSSHLYLYVARYAIGGLAGGEDKDSFWRVVAQCTAGLPENKPRYVMVYTSLNFFISFSIAYSHHKKSYFFLPA